MLITHLSRHAILSPPLQVHLLILLLTSWALPLAHDIPRGMHVHLDNVCNCGDIRNGEQLIEGAKMVMSGSVTITSFILRVKLKGANLQAPCADIVSLFLSRWRCFICSIFTWMQMRNFLLGYICFSCIGVGCAAFVFNLCKVGVPSEMPPIKLTK